jgi:chromosome segregation ATPase
MSTTSQEPSEKADSPDLGGRTPTWLLAVLVVLALVLGYVAYAQYGAGTELRAQLQQANQKITQLESRAATLEDDYTNVRAQSDAASKKLGLTAAEIARAKADAKALKEEQERAASLLQEQQTQLGNLSGEVGVVKTDVAATRDALLQTQGKLDRTIGDLGVQSGLIARSQEEVQELKRRGERDYFEFNIRKSKQYTRVGDVSVRLNKTDTKRQRFTVTLLANDKTIEKKDKTLLEPVQFYLQGTRHLLELVVYEVNKDQIVGYLSTPKELARR